MRPTPRTDAFAEQMEHVGPGGRVLWAGRLFEHSRALEREAAQARDDVNSLIGTLKWLDRWLGDRPMPECTALIRAAIAKAEQ